MRLFGLILCMTLLMVSCNNNTSAHSEWEYCVLPLPGQDASDFDEHTFLSPVDMDHSLNLYGKSGWELVSTYTTVETVYPNFGDKQYHTGVKENTRTHNIYFVFKRRKIE